jgi:hypothetical protein
MMITTPSPNKHWHVVFQYISGQLGFMQHILRIH